MATPAPPHWWKGLPPEALWHGVFQGGGAKGIAFAGALEAMEGHNQWFCSVAGSSAGALTASLVAAGFSPKELAGMTDEMLDAVHPGSVLDQALSRTRWTQRLTRYSAGALERALERRLREGLQRHGGAIAGDVTFSQLGITGISLYVLALDASWGRPLTFCAERTPDVAVSAAVAASCAIPLVFHPRYVEIDVESVPPVAAEHFPPLRRVVDGGAWANFPMFIYNDEAFRKFFYLNELPEARRVIGFVLDRASPAFVPAPHRFVEDPYKGRLLSADTVAPVVEAPKNLRETSASGLLAGLVLVLLCVGLPLWFLGVLVDASVKAAGDGSWLVAALSAVGFVAVAILFAALCILAYRLVTALRREGIATFRSVLGLATAPPVWVGLRDDTTIISVPTGGVDTTDFQLRDTDPETVRAEAKTSCNDQLREVLTTGKTFLQTNRANFEEWSKRPDFPRYERRDFPIATHSSGLGDEEA